LSTGFSLSDYETRLSDKIQLLLDAVLGFINIQQNDLFKILTIVSVVGGPTILVGIWGMNFKLMPELNWTWGYPFAWLVIIASGLLPLVWFKRRGWFDWVACDLACRRFQHCFSALAVGRDRTAFQ
jgi:magnesium transporter